MTRQEAFERSYAQAHDLPIETFSQYRMGDTYRLPLIAKCWRFWNLALDSEGQESMASVEEVAPLQCRQRLVAAGKPYPRSSCQACGAFSPKWRECDSLIACKNSR